MARPELGQETLYPPTVLAQHMLTVRNTGLLRTRPKQDGAGQLEYVQKYSRVAGQLCVNLSIIDLTNMHGARYI
jgi:hypothetical protein